MSCRDCGRDDGHWLGCPQTVHTPVKEQLADADQCAREGCTKARAASKGPRPAKYCADHKTGSKK